MYLYTCYLKHANFEKHISCHFQKIGAKKTSEYVSQKNKDNSKAGVGAF